jgi:hypothetical protein
MMASVIELTHQNRPDIRVHSYPTPKTSVACKPGGVHIRLQMLSWCGSERSITTAVRLRFCIPSVDDARACHTYMLRKFPRFDRQIIVSGAIVLDSSLDDGLVTSRNGYNERVRKVICAGLCPVSSVPRLRAVNRNR